MSHVDKEKWEKRSNSENRNAKSGKHQNSWREGNLQYLEILEADITKQR